MLTLEAIYVEYMFPRKVLVLQLVLDSCPLSIVRRYDTEISVSIISFDNIHHGSDFLLILNNADMSSRNIPDPRTYRPTETTFHL